jgi:hypothetical protein
VLPGRAVARLIQESSDVIYFHYMAVRRPYRKTGICTEFVKLTASYFGRWPELDIRHQSKVAQRVARNLGYFKVGLSQRYIACELWVKAAPKRELPQSILRIKSQTTYESPRQATIVLYLSGRA